MNLCVSVIQSVPGVEVTWGGRGALVQVFPGVAAALRLLMESAKRSIFLCQASISPWGYSSHFLLGTQGAGGA